MPGTSLIATRARGQGRRALTPGGESDGGTAVGPAVSPVVVLPVGGRPRLQIRPGALVHPDAAQLVHQAVPVGAAGADCRGQQWGMHSQVCVWVAGFGPGQAWTQSLVQRLWCAASLELACAPSPPVPCASAYVGGRHISCTKRRPSAGDKHQPTIGSVPAQPGGWATPRHATPPPTS